MGLKYKLYLKGVGGRRQNTLKMAKTPDFDTSDIILVGF